MHRKFHILLIIVLSLFYSPLYAKEINKKQESLSSSVAEIAEEMKHLNSNLKILSNTISNLMP